MQCVSILGFLCLAICLNWASSSSVYNMNCKNSSECTIYPNITQGPDWIWIPFFCNENNLCACPNGWIPLVKDNICIAKVLGSIESTCTVHIWAISFLVVSLLAVMIYSCTSLFSRRPRILQLVKNDQHLPPVISRAKV